MCGEEVHERTRIHHEHKHPEAIYPNLFPVWRRRKKYSRVQTQQPLKPITVFLLLLHKRNNYRSIWECLITIKHAFFSNRVKR